MAFHVYPDPQIKPRNIVNTGSYTFDVEQFTPKMVIRVAMFAPGVVIPPTSIPTLKVQADTGDAVTVTDSAGGTHEVFSKPGTDNTYLVGEVGLLSVEGGNVYAFTIDVKSSTTWKVTITNNDVSPRDFTLVVGDSDAESKQPWVDFDLGLNFDVLVNEGGAGSSLALKVRNMGTGLLTFTSFDKGGADAAKFTLEPTVSLLPNTGTAINVELTPQTSIGPLGATLTVKTNDNTAIPGVVPAGHNSFVNLTSTVRRLEVAFLVDASGSMARGPLGDIVSENSTRWTLLKGGLAAALTVLKNFGAGKGNFAVGMFPDISSFPKHPTDPHVAPFPAPSPSAADITAGPANSAVPLDAGHVDNAIMSEMEAHSPREYGGATPMGKGIELAITKQPNIFGYFDPSSNARKYNRRWAVIMSDGNHNSDPPKPQDFLTGGQYPSFGTKNVTTLTIAYGSDNAVEMVVNKDLLKQIAGDGGGGAGAVRFHDADLDIGTAAVMTFVKATILAGLSLDTLADPVGVLTPASPVVKRQVPITSHDSKTSFVVAWATFNAHRIRVQVQTPLGEILEAPQPGVTVDENPRFRMITVSREFIHNEADPANPRFGTWTLILTLDKSSFNEGAPAGHGTEQYDYQVLLESRLKLRASFDQNGYSAGDPIKISAELLLDGVGVPNAAVTLTRVFPGSSLYNFLGKSPLSEGEYKEWVAQQKSNPDIDSIALKAGALAAKGIKYTKSTSTDAIPLLDPAGVGIYSGVTPNTSVPGTYRFTAVAVGALPDGTMFRREQGVDVLVTVQADPAFSPIDTQYGQVVQGGTTFTTATVTVRPGDRFGNVILIDPSVDPTVGFTTSIGDFPGPIVDHHDGSYSSTAVYPLGTTPTVGVTVGGVDLTPGLTLAAIHHLKFVDRVYGLAPGREASMGMNQHTDPRACLGDPSTRPAPSFLSLGAGGSVVVGIGGHYMLPARGNDDVTVFIQPDQPLRPYAVQVMHGDHFEHGLWEEIGRSPGVTRSFSLRKSLLDSASAIRIVDLSRAVKNADGTPSQTPGVSVLAVGVRHIEAGDGDFDDLVVGWLKRVGHALFNH